MPLAPGALEASLVAARAVHVGACLLLFGELVASALWPGTLRIRVAVASALVAIVAALAWLALVALSIADAAGLAALAPFTLARTLTATVFGHVWMVRTALLLVVIALVARSGRARGNARATAPGTPGMGRSAPNARPVAACALAGACVGLLALATHAAATAGPTRGLQIGADALHVVAAGAWLGSLPALLHRLGHAPADVRVAVTRQWSRLATVAVAVLLASGVTNAAFRLHSIEALWSSDYGRVLGAKLALVLVMLVLAAYNRVRVTPQLARPPALRTLRHSGGIEVAIGAAVVVLAASLGTMAPPEPDGRHDHGVTSLPAPEGVAITPMQPQRRDEPLDPLRVAVYR